MQVQSLHFKRRAHEALGNETLLCLFNMSAEPAHAVLPEGQWTKLEGHGFASTTDNDRVELPAWGAYFARHA